MKKTLFALLAFLLMTGVGSLSAAQDFRIEPLSGDNYLIRISPDATEKYLLLPIEEAAPESEVRVVVNNVEQRTLQIRLALSKIDYYMPFFLDEFRGEHLILYAHVHVNRSNRGGAAEAVCIPAMKLSNDFNMENEEKYRPAYHHTPTYAWMNDPNGMFYLDGEWHLFYQYGPYGSTWNNMTWGHSVSRDLIHWEQRPEAIKPDAHGQIFSGSCVVDYKNTAGFGPGAVIALFTSAGAAQTQSLAYSLDGGNTFTTYNGNPILTADIPDFRDPNMFWYEPTQRWILTMSAGQEMRIYSSPNLKDWTFESSFGHGYGSHDGVWECPDLMELPVEGGKKDEHKWVLFCNINPGGPAGGSATQYFVGDFDGHNFTCCDQPGTSKWQDYGKDHYATVSFSNAPDGRHTMIAWMSNWQYANNVPTLQFRSQNSICREPFLYKVDGQYYLGSRPSPEYDNQGLDEVVKIKGSKQIVLSNAQGEEFIINYDEKAMTLSVDRSKSGQTRFSPQFPVLAKAPVYRKLTSIRIFVDNCSVEVFGNDGEVCLTSLVFPQTKLQLKK